MALSNGSEKPKTNLMIFYSIGEKEGLQGYVSIKMCICVQNNLFVLAVEASGYHFYFSDFKTSRNLFQIN